MTAPVKESPAIELRGLEVDLIYYYKRSFASLPGPPHSIHVNNSIDEHLTRGYLKGTLRLERCLLSGLFWAFNLSPICGPGITLLCTNPNLCNDGFASFRSA